MRSQTNKDVVQDVVRVVSAVMPHLPYHNLEHALEIYKNSQFLAQREGIKGKNAFLLGIAALLHDVIYIPGDNDNEECSAIFAYRTLLRLNFSDEEASFVADLVNSSAFDIQPKNIYEKILHDADTANFGRTDFFEKNAYARAEFAGHTDVEWYSHTLSLLEAHSFYTMSAKLAWSEAKQNNIEKLQELLHLACKKELLTNGKELPEMVA